MTTITHVKAARLAPGNCGRCSTPIEKGQPYVWIAFFRRPKQVRCMKCGFKRSETCNSKLAAVYAAQENAEELIRDWKGEDDDGATLKGYVEDAAEAVRDVIQEYDDVANEFPNLASQSEEIRSELESIADTLDGFDVEEWDAERYEDRAEWIEQQRDEAASAIGEMSNV